MGQVFLGFYSKCLASAKKQHHFIKMVHLYQQEKACCVGRVRTGLQSVGTRPSK